MMWIRTDERKEAIDSLEKTYQFILEVYENPSNWKWVIIALHNSAQAFMVLALKGTASMNVLYNPDKSLAAVYGKGKYPKERLLIYLDLYSNIKSKDHMKMCVDSKVFSGSKETDEAMERLNEFRNKFIHYVPCSWSLEISGLPGLCELVLSVIEFLICESGNIRFYENDNSEKANLAELIAKIRRELEGLEIEYNKAVFGGSKEDTA